LNEFIVNMTPEVDAALEGLQNYTGGGDSVAEDALFQVHTDLTVGVLGAAATRLNEPVLLWERIIAPATEQAEKRLGKPIHKGAPLYNTGVCLFLLNDFDGAFQYFVDADEENRRLGPGGIELLIGKDALSRRLLIDQLFRGTAGKWADDYRLVNGVSLDAGELVALLDWLGKRASDAFVAIAALHRIFRADSRKKPNRATRLIVVRSLGDLLIVLESAIRRLQGAGVSGQLGKRMPALVFSDARILNAYKNVWAAKATETAAELNAVVAKATQDFATAKGEAERAGIICYAVYRLRNSLLHVNEESLDLCANLDLGVRMTGWALAACRVARHSEEMTFQNLS
jgi:hypothetical protein